MNRQIIPARLVAFTTFGLMACLSAIAFGSEWNIDSSHSSARFKVRHMMVSNVEGTLTGITGKMHIDDKDISKLKTEATVDATTINTSDAKRDGHLKSPDFFDTTKFPTITFKSKKVVKGGNGKFKLVGDFTMHGVTKDLTIDVEELTPVIKDMSGNNRRGLTGTASLNRGDYGVSWNKTMDKGGAVVGDKIDITVSLEMTEAKAEEKPKG